MLNPFQTDFYPAFRVGKANFLAILPDIGLPPVPESYNALMSDPTFKPDVLFQVSKINEAGDHIFALDGVVYKSASLSAIQMHADQYGLANYYGGEAALKSALSGMDEVWSLRMLHRSKMTVADLQNVLLKVEATGTIIETRESKFIIHYPRANSTNHPVEYNFDKWDRALVNLQRYDSARSI